MLSKENIEKQVADNQMDYVDAESTIGAKGDEDRLSSEELRCGQSQKSPGVTRSSSISSDDTCYSEPNDTDDSISNEVTEKATFFVKTFVRKFEEELSKLSKEAEPGSNIQKIGKASASFSSALNNTIPASPLKLLFVKVNESINYFVTGKRHKKGAESISAIIDPGCKGETRKILVEAGLSIFQKFEQQFIKVVDVDTSCWSMGIQKLAIDAVSRIMNRFLTFSEEKDLSVNLVTEGVVLGESKRKALFDYTGYKIKGEKSSEILTTSGLYELVGVKKAEGEVVNYYQYNLSEDYDHAEKYGYRLPFAWEIEEWEEVKKNMYLLKHP